MWEPRIPLVKAEAVVDYPRINDYITERRDTVERALRAPMERLADSLVFFVYPSMEAAEEAQDRLYRGLAATYLFGFREARREITALRRGHENLLADAPPTRQTEISSYLNQFVATLLHGLIDKLTAYAQEVDENDPMRQTRLRERAQRLTHNLVLESIGQVLNAGRTFAAIGHDEPILAARAPAVWAMRSEQLDQNTCTPCEHFHGETARVGTFEYFEVLPPLGCLGRGRCRGVMVYADDPADFLSL